MDGHSSQKHKENVREKLKTTRILTPILRILNNKTNDFLPSVSLWASNRRKAIFLFPMQIYQVILVSLMGYAGSEVFQFASSKELLSYFFFFLEKTSG